MAVLRSWAANKMTAQLIRTNDQEWTLRLVPEDEAGYVELVGTPDELWTFVEELDELTTAAS